MTPHEFQRYLTLYGSRIERWPPVLAFKARMALRWDANLRRLQEAEGRFEEQLRDYAIEPPSPDFCQRIAIRAALRPAIRGQRKAHPLEILDELCRSLALPSPRMAIGALAIAGMALGFFANSLFADITGTNQETAAFSVLFHVDDQTLVDEQTL